MTSEPGVRSLNVNGGTGKGKAKTTALRRAISPRSYPGNLRALYTPNGAFPKIEHFSDKIEHFSDSHTAPLTESAPAPTIWPGGINILSLAVDHFDRDATEDTMFTMLGARKESSESDPEEVG